MAHLSALPDLVLSSKRSVWRMHDHADEADKAFRLVRKIVLEASDYACQFCGHRSEKYQEVHHIDDNHKNNKPSNLATSCPLCHQVFHVGLAGMKEGGDLVYVPELSQAEINQVALVIWLTKEAEGQKFSDPSQATLQARLHARATTLEGMIGNRRGTVLLRLKSALKDTAFPQEFLDKLKLSHLSPTLLSSALMALPDALYEKRGDLLGGLRIFPNAVRFRERIKFWSQEQAAVLPLPTWYKIIPEEAVNEIIAVCTDRISALTRPSASSEN
jgi:intracellular multiplication protein IcmJ